MKKITDEDFIRIWNSTGSPTLVAEHAGLTERCVYKRRAALAARGVILRTISLPGGGPGSNGKKSTEWQCAQPFVQRVTKTVRDGYMVVFSDAHFWPGIRSIAFEALLLILKELQPKLIISNGDAFDGARISRHDPLGWQKLPTVIDELGAAKSFLGEISRAAPKADKCFVVGNHDSRFDRRLATEISDFEDVPGMSLRDHIKDWPMTYSVLVNEDTEPCYVVHNVRGGVYAPRNNVLAAGCTTFTGHLHSQKAIPVSTLLHDWEGVDSGMLAPRDGPQFSYVSSRPTDWRDGFAVQRLDRNGYRFPVDLCRVQHMRDGEVRAVFRGEVVIASRKSA